MTEQTLLDIQNVSKVIGKNTLVFPFDLSLKAGQVLALCGGNGAGKSTILRMIVGISQPTTGMIQVGNLEWKKDRRGYAELIGYMPDDFNFGFKLTAYEMLSFYAALKRVPSTRVEEVLKLVGLDKVKDKQVSTFSKGMRQRLLFAQALLAKPKLLILDEPTNGLDPYWMGEFVHLLQKIKSMGHGIIFSTHQLQVAEASADQVVIINGGRILKTGTVSEFQAEYGPAGLDAAFADLVSQR